VVAVDDARGAATLLDVGEVLDAFSAADLYDAVQAALQQGCREVELRLDRVHRIEPGSVWVLLRVHRAVRGAGGRLVLGPPSPALAVSLQRRGLHRVLPVPLQRSGEDG
jgi:anti-anti-sigma factor